MKNIYEEFALVNAKIAELTVVKDALKVDILNEMAEKGEKKVETGVGSFTVAKLKSWVYPDKVVKLGEDFKVAKAKAESNGEATYTENDSLRFTQIKL